MYAFVMVTPPSLGVLVVADVGDCGYICSRYHNHDLHDAHGGQILPTAHRCPHDIMMNSTLLN